jgi:hypothetical protein
MGIVLLPIGFAVAMLLGEGRSVCWDTPPGVSRSRPLGIRALVGVPATLIGLSPGAMALLYGMRARRGGLARGLVPAVIGALVMLYWILVTIAGLST